MKRIDILVEGFEGYSLIDSGEGRKLERFGEIVVDRPDPQALWQKRFPAEWQNAHAQFVWVEKGERWKLYKDIPPEWIISWNSIQAFLSLKEFKHIGIFPEHALQWEELQRIAAQTPQLRMLNLFGYTGLASVAAAQSGMHVTHVDASKQSIAILKQTIEVSGVSATIIRTVVEDTLKYAKRLIERGEIFDVIVMDPPAFGRGPKGEVWKIEEDLPKLLSLIPPLLSSNAKLVILNGYASGFAARTFGELLHDTLQKRGGSISYGDIALKESGQLKNSVRLLTTGMYGKWFSD